MAVSQTHTRRTRRKSDYCARWLLASRASEQLRRRKGLVCWGRVLVVLLGGLTLLFLRNASESAVPSSSSYSRISSQKGLSSDQASFYSFGYYDPTTLLAYQQSFGLFDDISNATWKRMQQLAQQGAQQQQQHRLKHTHHFLRSSARKFYAQQGHPIFSCPHMTRVGGLGEGPKWVCHPRGLLLLNQQQYYDASTSTSNTATTSKNDCLVYSIGSAGDYKFELGLAQLLDNHCEIHVFDPGPFAHVAYETTHRIFYHQWGLTSSYNHDSYTIANVQKGVDGTRLQTLAETMRVLGHQGRRIDILKIDCEGCEFVTFRDWTTMDVRQILVETHGLGEESAGVVHSRKGAAGRTNKYMNNSLHQKSDNPPEDTTIVGLLTHLQDEGYALFSKEPNMFVGGSCVEFGFVKLRADFWKRT